jgi:D-alanine-D-alanine ligase-like ATP-grasp enzyme
VARRRLPTPRYAILEIDTDWDAVVAELGLPIFVKPVHEGSSMGATKVSRPVSCARPGSSRHDTTAW